MIEAYALALQLYQEPKLPSLHEAVQQALNTPKTVLVGGPAQHHPNSLEMVVAQVSEGKDYTLEQVRRELEKPYLDHNKDGIIKTYEDLTYKGMIIKYALNKFPAEDLKLIEGMDNPFTEYLWNVIGFQIHLTSKILKSLGEDLTLTLKILEDGKSVESLNERDDYQHISDDLHAVLKEITKLIQEKGIE
ncbi:hypothetical protein HYY70_02775 [Candidatus Woesearchaeota archaeon]|nr:hypothetical protein [Candidatus Woesearchaeota archaeon]